MVSPVLCETVGRSPFLVVVLRLRRRRHPTSRHICISRLVILSTSSSSPFSLSGHEEHEEEQVGGRGRDWVLGIPDGSEMKPHLDAEK